MSIPKADPFVYSSSFVHEVEERQLRQTKLRRRGKTIADIIAEECRKCGVNEQD